MVGGQCIGEAIDPRRNSLNFLRLVLASMVLLSHAYSIGRFGGEGIFNRTSPATVAVYGFFGISGYLIAGSATRHHAGRYLWQRFLRIFPGFWVALLVTSLGFGLIGWLSQPHAVGYFDISTNTPFGFDYNNWLLDIRQLDIFHTGWNGSLWTLYYEFLCYLTLLSLGLVGLLRHRVGALVVAAGFWLTCLAITAIPSWRANFNVFGNWQEMSYLKFCAVFMVGAVIYLYKEKVPDSGWLALAGGVGFAASLWLPREGLPPAYAFTYSVLLAPLVAYPLLWLGAHLPFQKIGARNDYSYGVYVYAFPVTVLLTIWGANRWGYVPFAILCILGTIPLAVGSWWLIERRAMALRTVRWEVVSSKVFGSKQSVTQP